MLLDHSFFGHLHTLVILVKTPGTDLSELMFYTTLLVAFVEICVHFSYMYLHVFIIHVALCSNSFPAWSYPAMHRNHITLAMAFYERRLLLPEVR